MFAEVAASPAADWKELSSVIYEIDEEAEIRLLPRGEVVVRFVNLPQVEEFMSFMAAIYPSIKVRLFEYP